jgi:competence protein ComEA
VAGLPITRRQAITVAVSLAVVLLLAVRLIGHSGPTASPAAAPVPVRAGPLARPKVVVHVAGAVRRPGLYRLADGSRVADAIERAGGATGKANLEAVNLAAPLADGQQVLVPRSALVPASGAGATGSTAPAGPVSLSAATLEQLDTLPGIGPVTAQKIIDYRTSHGAFRSVDELDSVPGIGPARIETLRELVVP